MKNLIFTLFAVAWLGTASASAPIFVDPAAGAAGFEKAHGVEFSGMEKLTYEDLLVDLGQEWPVELFNCRRSDGAYSDSHIGIETFLFATGLVVEINNHLILSLYGLRRN